MLPLRTTSLILTLALLFSFLGCSSPDDESSSEAYADSTFQVRVDSTWSQVRHYWEQGNREKADSLQRIRAGEFFRYYTNHSQTELGRKAAETAFMMWGNVGAVKEVEGALSQLDRDSKIWARILNSARNAYGNEGRLSDYISLLRKLESTLSSPKSRSAALLQLAEHHRTREERRKAEKLYREVVNLDAGSTTVGKARSKLREFESLRVGQDAPNFKAKTLSDDTLSLSNLRGKVVLLEFWATWCGPCKPRIPHLKRLWSEFRNGDFMLVGVSLDRKADKLKQFIEERDMTWPQIQQPKEWDGRLVEQYSVLGVPRSYVIDRTGTIVAKDVREDKLEEEVRTLINKDQG